MLKTSDFNFHLPPELIANQPANPRDSAQMLLWQNQQISDKKASDLADFLQKDDVLVLNDSRVIKAKLSGQRGEAKVEINLHKEVIIDSPNQQSSIWQVFAKPAKRLRIGDKFTIAADFYAEVIDKNEDGIVDLAFNVKGLGFFAMLEKYGQIPLPPYIKNDSEEIKLEQDYQTIYAKNDGAVAAPTAGLHFTPQLLQKLQEKGVKTAFVTLNVGAGTFLPVKSDLIEDHQMHAEYFNISQETCDLINSTKKAGNKIIAVGTTSLRVLESAADNDGFLKEQARETDIFIYPPHDFKIVDVLMTNFHLPKSTLFMLISAFIGQENAHKIYQHAIANKYRFYSFGDANLLFGKNSY
jgi:S-adenosylmethionine:tRNA ribosyltransferase-isomerase